ncbi:MAG: acetyl-CoA carboxylase carboxyltransferase subunit beta [Oscillospiraceae bacterium]|nr:acetyl-CoA carboxylase carboxyltransferase subunit beta [Oscillospiraceae bacterium]
MDLFTFLKPRNELEGAENAETSMPFVPNSMWVKCPSCNNMLLASDLKENNGVCVKCKHHFRMTARERIDLVADKGTFEEINGDMTSKDFLNFPKYKEKLATAKSKSQENESVVTGTCEIGGNRVVLCVMSPDFMMGSMGTVTGEKVTRAFEYATEKKLPVIVFTVSGGARMQEGILSLMQMAKTSGAVKLHSDAGLLYITVLTDPTTGGVTASFAMEGDIILAEPNALVGFAGPRVVEQTTHTKLPKGFQRAEFVLDKGFIDAVVERESMKETLVMLLSIHKDKKEVGV